MTTDDAPGPQLASAGYRDVPAAAAEGAGRRWWDANAENREPSTHPDPAAFGLDLDRVRPLFAEYAARARSWTRR